VLGIAVPLVAGASFNRERISAGIGRGHLDATSLMEALITAGVPQRTAHETVGKLVRTAMDRGVTLSHLSDDECRAASSAFTPALREALGPARAVHRMQSYGSTAPSQVAYQLARWHERLTDTGASSD
jgi:argininosuccinate lyase